ncbi:hypothetical protein ACJJTC_009613 [Scirpophaga incertulas]
MSPRDLNPAGYNWLARYARPHPPRLYPRTVINAMRIRDCGCSSIHSTTPFHSMSRSRSATHATRAHSVTVAVSRNISQRNSGDWYQTGRWMYIHQYRVGYMSADTYPSGPTQLYYLHIMI